MTLHVEPFRGTAAEWDACVQANAGWTNFHRWGWKDVMEDVFNHDCLYLASYDETGHLAGVLPLVRARSVLFGDYLVSMPFMNYGGPLGTPAAVQALVQHAADVARESRVDLLELRNREPLALDVPPPVSHRKITCVLDLEPGNAEAVWEGLSSNVRRKVRRAEKEGFGVAFGLDQLDPFYRVFSRHMRALGTPTLPRRFFAALVARFPADISIGCVYHGARPVAGGFGFRWREEFELSLVSALQEYHRSYANMLLYWVFIERVANHGMRFFNFGRCTPGGGTHHFKQQWGSRDVPLPWYQPLAGRRAATPSPHERAFSWGPAVWKRLPLVLANALGPSIVRMIP